MLKRIFKATLLGYLAIYNFTFQSAESLMYGIFHYSECPRSHIVTMDLHGA
jgi:hypothetical protein